MDTSSIEAFINDGEEVFSARVYPDKNSKGIKFFAKSGCIKVNRIVKWDLHEVLNK
jgi:beta-fructofuranosidase